MFLHLIKHLPILAQIGFKLFPICSLYFRCHSELETEGPTIVHTDKLQEIMSSEKKATFDDSNIQLLGSNPQNNTNRQLTNDQQELEV